MLPGACGAIINIEKLNWISVRSNKTQAVIGGGVRVQALGEAGAASGVRFATATCNCLGFLGAALGGGLSRASGLYGMSVDQIVSMNVVLASGELTHVDASNVDLWWALRGAAPNFGIVTSAVIKAYEVPQSVAWEGAITFSDDKLGPLISAINDLYLQPHMQIDFLFSAAANGSTTITVVPFFIGTATEGRKAFQSILDIGYLSDGTSELPYDQWNSWADAFCGDGGRKPSYGASVATLESQTWVQLYQDFKSFTLQYPQARNSSVLAETYAINSSVIQNGGGSYPFRHVKTHAVVIPWYSDRSFDGVATAWGQKLRSLLRSTDGLVHNANYVNFAHGDESLQDIYGQNLGRLQSLKKKYDPENRFNQWFSLAR
ncbi:MAG: hypothetical protein M1821_006862 [Bathelium mastoideum]|nr:MAG: hypothetical protein M1821_006862 [Bathelium mastoideum]